MEGRGVGGKCVCRSTLVSTEGAMCPSVMYVQVMLLHRKVRGGLKNRIFLEGLISVLAHRRSRFTLVSYEMSSCHNLFCGFHNMQIA